VGPAEENFPVAAVISEEQHRKILAEIGKGKKEAEFLGGPGRGSGGRLLYRPRDFC